LSVFQRRVDRTHAESTTGHRVYVFRENGAYEVLAELPDPIAAVADNASATYVLAKDFDGIV
jgi:hypothetical protein